MTNKSWTSLALLLVFSGLIFTASCAEKKVNYEPAVTLDTSAAEKEDARRKDLAAQRALEEEQRLMEERLREEAKEREELAARHRFIQEDIHFEFDKSMLIPEAKETLRLKAEWLMAHPAVTVIIEGYCDERGTNEYNMALGNRRAESAGSFLLDFGIAPERLSKVTYGEEKPLDPDHNKEAWGKNRRVHFAID